MHAKPPLTPPDDHARIPAAETAVPRLDWLNVRAPVIVDDDPTWPGHDDFLDAGGADGEGANRSVDAA